jgi:hypothetical protein
MTRLSIGWLSPVLLLFLVACAASGPLLNSDRVQAVFGSYGVAVLQENEQRRVSSLYSETGDRPVTRTYAVVEYLGEPRPEYQKTHEAIVAGASIGASFRRAGWEIRKQHLFIGELDVPASYAVLGELMQLSLPESLAVHQYLFVISNENRSFSYARITEVHHPEFADIRQLRQWYGEIILDDSNRDHIQEFIGPPSAK